MKTLNEEIKTRSFRTVYLLYGPEDYLRHQYRDRLREAIVGMEDTINYSYFDGKGLDFNQLYDLCETMPFLADYRLVTVEESGVFASANEELVEYVKHIPETTVLLFVEKNVDKRSRLYKAIKSVGYAADMESPDLETLSRWVEQILKKEHKKMTKKDRLFFLSYIDTDMENIRRELEKLICYTYGREQMTEKDVLQVCTVHTENRIFDMITAVASRNRAQAMKFYQDLLALKEPPLRILYLIVRQLNQLLEIKELEDQGLSEKAISERTGIREFIVRKNRKLTKSFTKEELVEGLAFCTQMEEDVKTGKLADQIAVELVIYKLVSPKQCA